MAASDSTSSFENAPAGRVRVAGRIELDERLLEEIGRAERHGTQLSCLLVVVDNLDEMAGEGTAPKEWSGSCASRRWPTSRERCTANCAASTASGCRASASC